MLCSRRAPQFLFPSSGNSALLSKKEAGGGGQSEKKCRKTICSLHLERPPPPSTLVQALPKFGISWVFSSSVIFLYHSLVWDNNF